MENKAKRNNLYFVVTLFFILFLSTCDSPLSHEELNDPSLIAPHIIVEKNHNFENRSETHVATAHLRDENFNLVKIENGGVKINDITLDLKENILGGHYYKTTDITVNINVNYNAVITMSNGDTYDASVTSQAAELNEFTLPTEHNHNQDMNIGWTAASNDSLQIVWDYSTENESGSGTIEIPQEYWQSGEYTVPSSNFQDLQGFDVNFTLQSIKNGQIDSSFREGRIIQSIFSVTKKCTIN